MKTSASASRKGKPAGLRGIHVFLMIAGFFAVDFAINGLFVARAVGTFPGEDVKNSYVQGNDYNATLVRHDKQVQLGWAAQAGIENRGAGSRFVFRLHKADGQPVSDMKAALHWRRIGRDIDERAIDLSEVTPGEYVADLGESGAGRIAATVDVRNAGDLEAAFSASKILVLE